MEYYNTIAKSYNELHGEEQKRKSRIIVQHIKVNKTDYLLDVGCGTGIATELFDCKKVGIDPSKELITQVSFKALVGCAEALPFPDKSFDIVLCMTAIQHTDFNKALAEINRVAKRDIIITVLKKSGAAKEIVKKIKEQFVTKAQVDDVHDMIFFCQPKPI